MDNHAFEPGNFHSHKLVTNPIYVLEIPLRLGYLIDIELKISNHKSTGTVAVERRNGLVKNETCLGLKREIGLFGGVAMVAGSMIGK